MLIQIIPKSIRAKNRTKEHGEVMCLTKETPTHFLVISLDNTWQGVQWMGWFNKETEATYKKAENNDAGTKSGPVHEEDRESVRRLAAG
jgi:hypothetical protein